MPKSDDFNPKKIYDDLILRCRSTKAWFVYCYVDEQWVPKVPLSFDIRIVDGIVGCRVICSTFNEAQKIVSTELPVIRFIEEPEEDDNE